VAERLLFEAHLEQFRIALHQVAHDERHFQNEVPVFVFLLARFLFFGAVFIPTFINFARPFHPFFGAGVFVFVVDAFVHAAQDFHLVHALVAHTQISLEKVIIHDGAGDAHGHAAHGQVGLAAHSGHGLGGAGETQDFLGHVGGNRVVVEVLNVVAVDSEGGQAFLGVGGEHGSQIDGARTLRSVEAPHGFRIVGVHIHGFGAVAPARSHRDGGANALAFKLFGACGAFGHATDGAVGNHAFHGAAVAVFQVRRNQFGHGFRERHGFFFETLAHTALAAVNRGANANLRIVFHSDFWFCFMNFLS